MGRTHYEDRDNLTARELEVLRHAAAGATCYETGRALFVEAGTVKFHRTRLIRKLDARNIAHAVAIAHKQGLLGDSHERITLIHELLDNVARQLEGVTA